ncbi:DUF7287 family protein [Halosimplex amylolyticum]|uniref:DUF7287 family protein n=1 Tax=Halosimplex amylolyticum TaxID=3396616 RepID=UPI003F543D80
MKSHGTGPQRDGRTERLLDRRDGRGQTTLDFAIGMSIFLLALTFALAFVPGMLEPFSDSGQTETPAVNRVADDLTQRSLGNATAPYVLDSECTEAFFDEAVTACGFDGDPIQQRVGIVDRTPVNVTIRGDVGSDENVILCWDGSTVVAQSPSCGTVLTDGSNPAGSGGKTVSAQRVALLDGQDVTVEVVMW